MRPPAWTGALGGLMPLVGAIGLVLGLLSSGTAASPAPQRIAVWVCTCWSYWRNTQRFEAMFGDDRSLSNASSASASGTCEKSNPRALA